MKVLVTGGAGYLGSILVPLLMSENHQVLVMDTFKYGVSPILHFVNDKRLEIACDDIRDISAVRSAMRGQDLIIHLAAIVGYPACAANEEEAVSTNIVGTRNITRHLEGRRVVFASSCSVYGKVDGICEEHILPYPLTTYAQTKWESEKLIRDVGGVTLRFSTLFGVSPRLRLDVLINDFVHQAIVNGRIAVYERNFRRSFLHVVDAAKCCLLAIKHHEEMSGEVFNVSNETINLTKWELALKIKEYVDFQLMESSDAIDLDRRDYSISCKKLAGVGFRPEVSVDYGIRELIKIVKCMLPRAVALRGAASSARRTS